MDEDLESFSRDELLDEVRKLRAGIRVHRDSTGHDLCWHQPSMWNLLPETIAADIAVPEWPQFMRGCVRYRQSLDEQAPKAERQTIEFQVGAEPVLTKPVDRQPR